MKVYDFSKNKNVNLRSDCYESEIVEVLKQENGDIYIARNLKDSFGKYYLMGETIANNAEDEMTVRFAYNIIAWGCETENLNDLVGIKEAIVYSGDNYAVRTFVGRDCISFSSGVWMKALETMDSDVEDLVHATESCGDIGYKTNPIVLQKSTGRMIPLPLGTYDSVIKKVSKEETADGRYISVIRIFKDKTGEEYRYVDNIYDSPDNLEAVLMARSLLCNGTMKANLQSLVGTREIVEYKDPGKGVHCKKSFMKRVEVDFCPAVWNAAITMYTDDCEDSENDTCA